MVEDPLASAIGVDVCTRAATGGEDGVGDARWRPAVKAVESGGGAAGGFPSLAARPLNRVRV